MTELHIVKKAKNITLFKIFKNQKKFPFLKLHDLEVSFGLKHYEIIKHFF